MTLPAEKKPWCTPKVERFGGFAEATRENAKLLGSHDGLPFNDCPRGQFPCDANGGVS